jgi:hypothetical protein
MWRYQRYALRYDVHPRERKPDIIGQRPEARTSSSFSASIGGCRTRSIQREALFTWWALAQSAPTQHRLAYRLHSGVRTWAARTVSYCPHRGGESDHAPVLITMTEKGKEDL